MGHAELWAMIAVACIFTAIGIAAGIISPRIDRSFTLDEIAGAHAYLESGQQFGKVVVVT